MKTFFFILIILTSLNEVSSQSIFGKYEQVAFVAPDEYRDGENDMIITKDATASKKIWISNLINNKKFYAVLNTKNSEKLIYSVPKQTVGNYQINLGCITYILQSDDEDEEVGQISISLNNKDNCFGISQSDYDKDIKVGNKGVSAGGVKVGSNGNVKVPGVDVKNGNVKINAKRAMAGIQYVGKKI